MKAWALNKVTDLSANENPLDQVDMLTPIPGEKEILIRVSCCGVCHTELDEIEGRTPPPKFPVIPGHQVIGNVERKGKAVSALKEGDRVGVAWIFSACGECAYCRSGQENLCEKFAATGRDANGGYAEFMTVSEKFAYLIPATISDNQAAPLLCAGAIGYRSLMLAGLKNGQPLGLTGFGGSGHLVLKMAQYLYPQSEIIVFARSEEEQRFARSLGASWAGPVQDIPPVRPQSIIDTTPAWQPIVESLGHLKAGGRLVINAIRKETTDRSSLLTLSYARHLWMEKEIKSVANITRRDVSDFLQLASVVPIKPEVETYPFKEANRALIDLKFKPVKGTKVLAVM